MPKFIVSGKKFIAHEHAPTMLEYGLLVALIALVVAIAASVMGQGISSLFNTTANSI
jgi:pilus assembly protein Flp/PilA